MSEKKEENQAVSHEDAKQKSHAFCAKFRKEIEGSRLKGVLDSLVDSKSESLPQKKAFLTRLCHQKSAFRKQVEEYISALCKERPHRAVALLALRAELLPK